MKTKPTEQQNNIIRHIIAWGFIVLISLLLLNRMSFPGSQTSWQSDLLTWCVYIILFYVNYIVLMPRLLFRRRTITYVCCSLVLLSVSFGILKVFQQHTRKAVYSEFVRTGDRFSHLTPEGREKMLELELKRRNYYNWANFDPASRRNLPLTYGILLVFAASMVVRFIRKWKEEEQQRMDAEKEKIVAELEYLKQQINPHFLFNALNSIYSLTIPHSSVASDSVLKLSSILRYMLYETDKRTVPLADEITVIEDYIELQKLRLTPKTKVMFQVKGADINRYRIEPLLMIPFIENAFKYGTDSVEESFIDILLEMKGDVLHFSVRNKTVVGRKKDEKNSGIGIKNIRRRLELLYTDQFDLETQENQGIFYVSLTLKLRKN